MASSSASMESGIRSAASGHTSSTTVQFISLRDRAWVVEAWATLAKYDAITASAIRQATTTCRKATLYHVYSKFSLSRSAGSGASETLRACLPRKQSSLPYTESILVPTLYRRPCVARQAWHSATSRYVTKQHVGSSSVLVDCRCLSLIDSLCTFSLSAKAFLMCRRILLLTKYLSGSFPLYCCTLATAFSSLARHASLRLDRTTTSSSLRARAMSTTTPNLSKYSTRSHLVHSGMLVTMTEYFPIVVVSLLCLLTLLVTLRLIHSVAKKHAHAAATSSTAM